MPSGDFAADDVTSETFLVAFERMDTFDHGRDDARPWLFGIATNLLRRHHRAESLMLKALAKSASREALADFPAGTATSWTSVQTSVVNSAP
ncbi:sigma factor [Micrococcaceae bacterium Sec5.7]